MNLHEINDRIPAPDKNAMAAASARWDDVAKPVGSLGELENMLTAIAGIQRTPAVRLKPRAVLVFCGDNGVTAQGVAMTPPDITAVMTEFIARHRSSVCAMADCAGARVFPVDMGMFRRADVPEGTLLDRRIGPGTADFTKGPAMTRAQAEAAVETGMELVRDRAREGYQLLATGEMGIGNTTTSSAMAAVFLRRDPGEMTGPGVGHDSAGLMRKVEAIRKGIAVNKPDPTDGLDVLHKLGGFDIAGMAGAFLGGALYGIPVLIDGFISSVAALTAVRLCPNAAPYMLATHVSAEPAAALVLEALGKNPVLHAKMRLGEGTGAVAAMPLLDMAEAVYTRVMTYGDIGM